MVRQQSLDERCRGVREKGAGGRPDAESAHHYVVLPCFLFPFFGSVSSGGNMRAMIARRLSRRRRHRGCFLSLC